MEKKYKVGYTQGTFDMFHIGHLNLLKNAKELCDCLIVGVNSDCLVKEYKHKIPVISQIDRSEILKAIRYVDNVVVCDTLDKLEMHDRLQFDVIFIGDDWKGTTRWSQTELVLRNIGVDVVYLAYTKGISSTILRQEKINQVEE